MSSVNKAVLIGHVGQKPEIRTTPEGSRVANFSLATSERWTDKRTGEKKERTEWHRIVVWNDALIKTIEQYVNKGDKLYVEGAIQTRKWEKDGADHYTTEIVLKGFNGVLTMLSSKKDSAGGEESGGDPSFIESAKRAEQAADPQAKWADDDMNDEIPFAWVGLGLAMLPLLGGA